jgi:hypothetical protein
VASTDPNTDEEDTTSEGAVPLRTLSAEGRRLVDSPFLRGERANSADNPEAYTERHSSGVHVDLTGLGESLREIAESHDRYDPDIDAAAAPVVHRHVDVPRRVAADPGVWHYLTVVKFPDFVRHRWEFSSEAAMREKFLGAGTDIYSNALHRLWWIAELTHDDDDYSLTRQVLQKQTLANKVFDRWFARYRPAVIALCSELIDEPTGVAEEVTLRLNRALSTLQLEGMDESELRSLVQRLLSDVRRERTSE